MYDTSQVNEDILILMGRPTEQSKIPSALHMKLVEALLDQDEPRTARQIRNTITRLRNGENITNLTNDQASNILEMLSAWTERYPLNE